jgi:CheY-like chemotaxis protein
LSPDQIWTPRTAAKTLCYSTACAIVQEVTRALVLPRSGDGGFSEFEFGIQGKIVCENRIRISVEEKPVELNTESHSALPKSLTVVVVEDSLMLRKVLIKTIRSLDINVTQCWVFEEFATAEAAQPRLLEIADDAHTIVTVDQNMEAMGGVCKGTDLIKWLAKNSFKGAIVSASGDSDIGLEHKKHGATHIWGKPLKKNQVLFDIMERFAPGPNYRNPVPWTRRVASRSKVYRAAS